MFSNFVFIEHLGGLSATAPIPSCPTAQPISAPALRVRKRLLGKKSPASARFATSPFSTMRNAHGRVFAEADIREDQQLQLCFGEWPRWPAGPRLARGENSILADLCSPAIRIE